MADPPKQQQTDEPVDRREIGYKAEPFSSATELHVDEPGREELRFLPLRQPRFSRLFFTNVSLRRVETRQPLLPLYHRRSQIHGLLIIRMAQMCTMLRETPNTDVLQRHDESSPWRRKRERDAAHRSHGDTRTSGVAFFSWCERL